MKRREAIRVGLTAVAASRLELSGSSSIATTSVPAPRAPEWLTLLGRSEKGGRDYQPRVEGTIPRDLHGSLYRNGPGLFERGGERKPHLLDGDGLVQRLSFRGGKVRYQNSFVRTARFEEEERANRYLHATWTMRKPGGMLENIGLPHIPTQAGITVYPFGGSLYAFDEVSPPYRLGLEDLKTLGPKPLGNPLKDCAIKAHTKFDPITGEWLLFGITHGRKMKLHAIVHAADGTLKMHQEVDSPRQIYIHDFFATEKHFIFLLHPMWFSPWPMLAGMSSYVESLSWSPRDGNLVLVLPRGGGAPKFFEAPGAFMWHAFNAYEMGDDIIADFIAYDTPDHFIPHDAFFYRIMQGETGKAHAPGKLRRYRMNRTTGRLREEIVDAGTHEFPLVDPRVVTRKHQVGFMAAGGLRGITSAIKRVDFDSGHSSVFDFGPMAATGEPVFVAKPGGTTNQGWLITQVLDGTTKTTFFAIFDAMAVEHGPVAKIWLSHHLPISFHGWWHAA